MPELVLAGVLLAGADATPREVTLLDLDALPGEAWASLQLEQAEAHLATLEAMRGYGAIDQSDYDAQTSRVAVWYALVSARQSLAYGDWWSLMRLGELRGRLGNRRYSSGLLPGPIATRYPY